MLSSEWRAIDVLPTRLDKGPGKRDPSPSTPSYGLHVSGAGRFSLSPARPSPPFLAIEGKRNLETESWRRKSTKTASWNRLNQQIVSWLAPILKKKEYGTFQISFCFKLAFPNTCDLLTLAQSRNAVISVSLSEHGEMATRGLPIRPPRPRLRMVTLPAPWRRPVAFHRPK